MSTNRASREEAKNFHVLPKDGAKQPAAGKQPRMAEPTPTQQNDVSLSSGAPRDPEAGSAVDDPTRSGHPTQEREAPRRRDDLSQVS